MTNMVSGHIISTHLYAKLHKHILNKYPNQPQNGISLIMWIQIELLVIASRYTNNAIIKI